MIGGGLLRRLLEPVTITTADAPTFAADHIDITCDVSAPDWRAANPAIGYPLNEDAIAATLEVEVPPAADEPRLDYVDDRPAVDRGVCYHHLHIEYDGRRFGALIHEHQRSASLLPCPYVGKDGR